MRTCRTCGQELQGSILPTFTGTSGTVQISLTDVPALVCPQGHEKRMIDPEFPLHVLDNIMADIPWTVEKGFILKQHFCRKCNSLLQTTDASNNEQFETRIPWRSDGFNATISGPSVKCSACMTVQMPTTKQLRLRDIPNTIIAAFENANLKR